MRVPLTVEGRLREWGRYKFYPGWEEPSPSAVLGKLMDEGRDKRRKRHGLSDWIKGVIRRRLGIRRNPIPCKETRGVRMEIVVLDGDSTACPPDGGAGAMVERMASAIEKSRRCREVGEIIDLMPHDLFQVLHHTYGNCASPREVPRKAEAAWTAIGISKATYFRRKSAMLQWLEQRLMAVDSNGDLEQLGKAA